jgi:hypothetical protein
MEKLMALLRKSWGGLLLSTGFAGLVLSSSPAGAAESSNQAPADLEETDVAKIQAGGHIAFVSSGQRLADFHAIDDDRRTVFEFSTADPRPTLIVRVNGGKPIHRVSVVPGSETQKVDVYLLNGSLRDPSELDKIKPLTSIVDLAVGREASAEFAPQPARYVVLRWTLATLAPGPFRLAEISVFTRTEVLDAAAPALAAADPPAYPIVDLPVIAPVSP